MAAVVRERRSRQTGTVVQVWDNRDGGFDCDDPNGWFTVCVDHGGVCSHETRSLAQAFQLVPREWCPGCQAIEARTCVCGEPEDGGDFGWFDHADGNTYCGSCGDTVPA